MTYNKFSTVIYEGIPVKNIIGPNLKDYPSVEGMVLDNTTIELEKIWDIPNNEQLAQDGIESIDFYILEDTDKTTFNKEDESTYYLKITLNESSNWSEEISISPGVLDSKNELKTSGHTYSIIEDISSAEYQFTTSSIHPMLDGSTHAGIAQKKDLTDVVITNGNHTIKPLESSAGHYVFTATNERMGFLKIQKTVLYNGENPTDLDDKTILDGTYTFAVCEDEDCLMPVQINGEDLTVPIEVINGEPKTSDLLVLSLGTYFIREIASTNAGAVLLNDEVVQVDLTSTSTHDEPTVINIQNNYLDIALPVTGGHGTIINNIIGILMIIISITILIKGKRLKNETN